jgi:transcriptional regulator GlxA family with amidase domain
MSERPLARRLSAGGASFRELLDSVRKDLGLGYMDESRYPITDVAYLLGFSDQSTFARSFRRCPASRLLRFCRSQICPRIRIRNFSLTAW